MILKEARGGDGGVGSQLTYGRTNIRMTFNSLSETIQAEKSGLKYLKCWEKIKTQSKILVHAKLSLKSGGEIDSAKEKLRRVLAYRVTLSEIINVH